MRHCLVLPLTLMLLIGTKALQGIEQIAQQDQHGLALATQLLSQLRKLIQEKGGLKCRKHTLSPTARRPCGPSVSSSRVQWLQHLPPKPSGNTTSLSSPCQPPSCTRLIQSAVTRLSPLHLAGQLHPVLAITALHELPQRATLLITDQHDTRYSLLHQHSKAPHIVPNVRYDCYPCRCGCIHIAAKTTRQCAQGGNAPLQ